MLASGAFLTYDYVGFRRAMESRLRVLTEVMGTQTTPALAFNDPRVASEILGTLAASPQIVSAAIYNREGVLLPATSGPAPPGSMCPARPAPTAFAPKTDISA